MTDAQIRLYAALRVALPVVWRIRGQSSPGDPEEEEPATQVVFFERDLRRSSVTLDGLPFRVDVVTELLALIVSRPLLEDPKFSPLVIAVAVEEAKAKVGLT